ncbi:MAG: hypothetical protein ABFD98_17380 [Syntrophobacteraceae bacterium]|nr:hypothetical protein [Desulfobacteraceae bacterium]
MERITIAQVLADLKTLRALPDLAAPQVSGIPEALKALLRWMIQQRAVSCEQLAGFFGESETRAQFLAAELSARGLIEHVPTCGIPVFRVSLIPPSLNLPLDVLRKLQ